MIRKNWKWGVAIVLVCATAVFAQRIENGAMAVFLDKAIPAGGNTIGQVTLPANVTVDLNRVAGVATAVNSGDASTGTARVVTAQNLVASANNDGACVNVTTSSTTVLSSFSTRKWASITNRGTATVFVKFGGTATSSDFPVDPGAAFNWPSGVSYTGVVDAISSSGTQSVCVVEW